MPASVHQANSLSGPSATRDFGPGAVGGSGELAASRAVPNDAPPPVRVVIAEDSYVIREFLTATLSMAAAVELVAVCCNGKELQQTIETWDPDVVLTDIRMPPSGSEEGVRIASRLRDSHPNMGVVVLSQYAEPAYALALLENGADRRAYLLKERVDELDQLTAAIEAVANGGSFIDARVVESLVAARSSSPSPLDELTPRELEVLAEMANGRNNAAIAASLFLAERSVEKVIHSIFLKLGLGWETAVHKRVKAVLLYLAEQGE
jgi:DNA-binding NarL/FixJ family response regulator